VLIEKRWLKEAVEATQYIYISIIEQIALLWSDPLLEDIKSERIALVTFGRATLSGRSTYADEAVFTDSLLMGT
jgi:hypothetical protein